MGFFFQWETDSWGGGYSRDSLQLGGIADQKSPGTGDLDLVTLERLGCQQKLQKVQ